MSWKISPSVKRSMTTAMTWMEKGTGEAHGDYTPIERHISAQRGPAGPGVTGGQESKTPSAPLLDSPHPHPSLSTSEPSREGLSALGT